ncbi:hypothetical protein [Flavisolibacter tropicus]|nr:hypothetical protein [Flavisolibacter tropicus]
MKDAQMMMNLLLSMIGLTLVSAIANFGVEDILFTERVRAIKQGVISCGYGQSTYRHTAYYMVNRNECSRLGRLSLSMLPVEDHSKSSGNGCSHQPNVGAMLCGSVGTNRKLLKICTVS